MNSNNYLSLAEAAQNSPGRPSANAVWRWCRRGLRVRGGDRLRLHHVRVGGRIYTRPDWLDAFFEALADADAGYFQPNANTRCDSKPAPPGQGCTEEQRRALEEDGLR